MLGNQLRLCAVFSPCNLEHCYADFMLGFFTLTAPSISLSSFFIMQIFVVIVFN